MILRNIIIKIGKNFGIRYYLIKVINQKICLFEIPFIASEGNSK